MQYFGKAAALIALNVGLVACDTTVPDSGAGVGFGNYQEYSCFMGYFF